MFKKQKPKAVLTDTGAEEWKKLVIEKLSKQINNFSTETVNDIVVNNEDRVIVISGTMDFELTAK